MSNRSQLYAPSLYWFRYQYYKGLMVGEESDSPETFTSIDIAWVQERYQTLLAAWGLKADLPLRDDSPSRHFELLQGVCPATERQRLRFSLKQPNCQGFIYPQVIHDCYALNWALQVPEKMGQDGYSCQELAQLNPQQCFLPISNSPLGDVGQTLLLTAYVAPPKPENPKELEAFAQGCLQGLVGENPPQPPPRLYRCYSLLGGYLFEYGDPDLGVQDNPYGHVLIWFFFDEEPTQILPQFYWQLIDLFLYYHKITKIFQDSRGFYRIADKLVDKNEAILKTVQKDYLRESKTGKLSELKLEELKGTLKQLLTTSLDYSKQLRNLEYSRNSIAINRSNYQAVLARMEQLAGGPLEAFRVFLEKEATGFETQIGADLNYFNQGSMLLNQGIATIRGLVDVDQAECDRDRYISEKEQYVKENQANQALEDQIQSIGVGIAAGAIVASASGLMTQGIPLPGEGDRDIPPPTLFILVLGLSVFCSWGSWKLAKNWIEKRREAEKSRVEGQTQESHEHPDSGDS